MGVLVVSGTGTCVGKTVVTAAVAALARARGETVAVVKPAQTGEPPGRPGDTGDRGDLSVILRLAGVTDLHELARFADPLSPETAAKVAGRSPPDLHDAAFLVAELAASRQQVLVEGAGGLLVRYDPAGATIADLAAAVGAAVLVVTAAGLGTLNHTALTLEALARRRLRCAGVIIGRWPTAPELAERCNIDDLAAVAGQPVAGAVPDGAGTLDPAAFLRMANASLAPALGGSFDHAEFRRGVEASVAR